MFTLPYIHLPLFLPLSFILSSHPIPTLILFQQKKITFNPTYNECNSAQGVNWHYHAVNSV